MVFVQELARPLLTTWTPQSRQLTALLFRHCHYFV